MPLTDAPRLRLIGVVAAAALAVGGVLLGGPLLVGAPLWSPARVPLPLPTFGAQQPSPGPEAPDETTRRLAHDAPVLLGALLVLALAAFVGYAIRRAARSRLPDERTAGARSMTHAWRAASPVEAPAVGDELRGARVLLDEPGRTDDAVIRAWLALEDAAIASGTPRRPAETPSEYVARLVRGLAADGAAAGELRRLYERARFGGAPLDGVSAIAARECLLRLERTWPRESVR